MVIYFVVLMSKPDRYLIGKVQKTRNTQIWEKGKRDLYLFQKLSFFCCRATMKMLHVTLNHRITKKSLRTFYVPFHKILWRTLSVKKTSESIWTRQCPHPKKIMKESLHIMKRNGKYFWIKLPKIMMNFCGMGICLLHYHLWKRQRGTLILKLTQSSLVRCMLCQSVQNFHLVSCISSLATIAIFPKLVDIQFKLQTACIL